ncbi:GNAT family N-acetyltransferase [Sphaerisporangium perillae]|uniref:GNAT family N-acetyltransferase n=1 Tax=Sphaerisporangium perillae TaxID=2935860 RepID=UPI00200FCE01|nr:GNAT family N-acetyltransferase [Sphaerisporangium perillae]
MAWRDLMTAPASGTKESPLESARFGCSIERLTVSGESGSSFSPVRAAILGSDADVIILRYPAERIDWFAKMTDLGRTTLLADSLVYWRLAVGRGRGAEPSGDLWASELRDPAMVEALVLEVFARYESHYLANPLFDAAELPAGYAEWARRSAGEGGCLALYARSAGEEPRVIGLATMQDDGPRTEILLAGVVPEVQGRGLYAHVLKAVEDRARARGATEVVISTQGHHTRVQRAWARYGFEPVRTFFTVHLVRAGLLPPV